MKRILAVSSVSLVLTGILWGQGPAAGGPGPEQARLAGLEGDWNVQVVSDQPQAAVVGSAEAVMRLDGRFLEVSAQPMTGPVRNAVYVFGFDDRNRVYQVMLMDSAGNYFVTARSLDEGASGRIKMYGRDDDPHMKSLGFDKEFVIVLEIESKDRFVIETLFIDTRTEERKELPFLKLLFLR